VTSTLTFGITLTNSFADVFSHFEKVIAKLRSTSAYWERFNLSLSGRIQLDKSLLLSQVNYLGSIFDAYKTSARENADNFKLFLNRLDQRCNDSPVYQT
jgi:hypothetical protein